MILLLKATRLKRESSYSRRGGRGGGGAGGSSSRGARRGAGEGHLRNEIPKPVGGTAPGLRAGVGAPHVRRCGCSRRSKRGYRIEFTGPCRLTRSPMWTRIPAKGEPPSRHGDGPPENARKTSCEDRRPSAGRARLLLFPLF